MQTLHIQWLWNYVVMLGIEDPIQYKDDHPDRKYRSSILHVQRSHRPKEWERQESNLYNLPQRRNNFDAYPESPQVQEPFLWEDIATADDQKPER